MLQQPGRPLRLPTRPLPEQASCTSRTTEPCLTHVYIPVCRYVASSPQIDYSAELRLAASVADGASYKPPGASGPFHFITECFFLTAHGVHVGLARMCEQLKIEGRAYSEASSQARHHPGDADVVAEVRRVYSRRLQGKNKVALPARCACVATRVRCQA
jgi:hypothetical protein